MIALIVSILCGCLIGWLAGKIFKGSGNGFILNCIVGIVGSWLGNFLFGWLLPSGSIWAFVGNVLGAVVLLWIISKIRGKK